MEVDEEGYQYSLQDRKNKHARTRNQTILLVI